MEKNQPVKLVYSSFVFGDYLYAHISKTLSNEFPFHHTCKDSETLELLFELKYIFYFRCWLIVNFNRHTIPNIITLQILLLDVLHCLTAFFIN